MRATTIITIAGIIGSGKTTLFNKIKTYIGEEDYHFIDEYIPDDIPNFYQEVLKNNKPKVAYEIQMRLLYHRFNQLFYALHETDKNIICDGGIWLDRAYARSLHHQGYMTDNELEAYSILQRSMQNYLYTTPTHHIIYVGTPIKYCLENIATRGRDNEILITEKYLTELQNALSCFVDRDYYSTIHKYSCTTDIKSILKVIGENDE